MPLSKQDKADLERAYKLGGALSKQREREAKARKAPSKEPKGCRVLSFEELSKRQRKQ